MRFPKNQSLVSDRNVARCRGEGRSGFTKQNNFRIKMIYGCIEDIAITENFDAPKDRSWKNAASSMRSGKRLGGIPGSTRGPLSFGNVSISLCDEKPNEKGLKHSVSLFLEGISPYQLNSAMHLERFYKETICRWQRFRSSWWGISFLKMQGTDRRSSFKGMKTSFGGASTQIWIFGASISARFNSTRCSKSFGFFSMLRKKISRPRFESKIEILAFTGRKGTGRGFTLFHEQHNVENMQI